MQPWSRCRLAGLAALAGLIGASAGCKKAAETKAEPKPVDVVFARAVAREVVEYEEFTGRTEAKDTVDLRSRVTGYLNEANFKEGVFVKKGDLLFEIDPRTYQADVDRAEAQVRQAEATQKRLGLDLARARRAGTAVTPEELDKITGNRTEAEATVAAAKAAVESMRLSLGFTKITAPMGGRISRRLVDPGNLVKADDTLLTTIVSLDPIYAYFDIDEPTVLRLRRLIQKGELKSAQEAKISVRLALADDQEKFSMAGYIDFVDSRLDPGTGTLRIRVLIDNPKNLLSPGMFLRMRLPVSLAQSLPLVPEEALASDQGQRYVYVLDKDDKAVQRPVDIGQLQPDGLRAIKGKGVEVGDRVVVAGQQKIGRGTKVAPEEAKPRGDGKEKAAPARPSP